LLHVRQPVHQSLGRCHAPALPGQVERLVNQVHWAGRWCRSRRGPDVQARFPSLRSDQAFRASFQAFKRPTLRKIGQCVTCVILAVLWGLTGRVIRLTDSTRWPGASGAPWSHCDPATAWFSGYSPTKPSPPALARDSVPLGTLVALDT